MSFCKPEYHRTRRTLLSLLVIGSSIVTARLPAAAQEAVTVQGEIVDLACYLTKGSKGTQHRACAQMCAKKGVPIGVLTDTGDVFLIVDNHEDPDPYEAVKKLAGDRAEVSGKKFVKGGVAAIMVTGAKAP